MKCEILDIIQDLCSCDMIDPLISSSQVDSIKSTYELEEGNLSTSSLFHILIKFQKENKLSSSQLSILKSLFLRIKYGGMKGDMKFMEQYAYQWLDRFLTFNQKMILHKGNQKEEEDEISNNNNELLLEENWKEIFDQLLFKQSSNGRSNKNLRLTRYSDLVLNEPLRREDICKFGIDFHVLPNVFSKVKIHLFQEYQAALMNQQKKKEKDEVNMISSLRNATGGKNNNQEDEKEDIEMLKILSMRSESDLKSLMWKFWSGVNKRRRNPPKQASSLSSESKLQLNQQQLEEICEEKEEDVNAGSMENEMKNSNILDVKISEIISQNIERDKPSLLLSSNNQTSSSSQQTSKTQNHKGKGLKSHAEEKEEQYYDDEEREDNHQEEIENNIKIDQEDMVENQEVEEEYQIWSRYLFDYFNSFSIQYLKSQTFCN